MRKLFIILSMIIIFISSCGPSSSEKEVRMVADSIRKADSMSMTQMEQQKLKDSLAVAPTPVATHPQTPITTPQHVQYMLHNPTPLPSPQQTMMLSERLPDSVITINKAKYIGEIKHLVKDTMRYGKLDTVELTVSYNCPTSTVVQQVSTFHNTPVGNITTTTTVLTPTMRARLIDPSGGFVVVPITDTVQIVEMKDGTYTLWQWMVTPKKGGNQELIFSVDMIIGSNIKSIKTYQDKIYVYINPSTIFWNWVKLNWAYITGFVALLISLFTLREKIIGSFKKREREKN